MSDDLPRFSSMRHPGHIAWNENENRKRSAMMNAVLSGNVKPAPETSSESEAMTPDRKFENLDAYVAHVRAAARLEALEEAAGIAESYAHTEVMQPERLASAVIATAIRERAKQ